MNDEEPYWDIKIEPLLNTPKMKKIQLEKLKTMPARLKAGAPFFRKMIEESKMDPEKLTGFDEFRDKVGLFDKEALRELVAECRGDLLGAIDQIIPVSVDDLDYMATTTGTTGIPTPYPMTNNDVANVWGKVMARGGWRAGVCSHDRVLFCLVLSMLLRGCLR